MGRTVRIFWAAKAREGEEKEVRSEKYHWVKVIQDLEQWMKESGLYSVCGGEPLSTFG